MRDRRPRGQRSAPTRQTVYSSVTADVKMRGMAQQIAEKCQALGDEAERDKDRVTAEMFYQTADHYRRVDNEGKNHVTE